MSLENLIAESITKRVAESINIKDLNGATDFIIDLISKNSPTLEIIFNKKVKEAVKIDNCHKKFKEVLNHLKTGEPLFLTGPAGSGKSTIAEQCALALKMDFGLISVCAQTTKSDFLGYQDAHGNYVPTIFRKIYEQGGIFLIDEIDAGNPNVLAILNAALSGKKFAFPDNVVNKHEDFLLISTANTLGRGSSEYIGRNQLDAATLDRFNFIHIDYDNVLEKALVGKKNSEVLKNINDIRGFCGVNNINIIISTRSIIKIIKLLEADFTLEDAMKSTIFKCTEPEVISQIMSFIGRKNGVPKDFSEIPF